MSHLAKGQRVRTWALVHQAPGAEPEVWLGVLDVPAELSRQEVELALQSWPQWSRWAARTSIGGRLTVRLWRAKDNTAEVMQPADFVAWAEVIPEAGRFTIEVDAALRAAVRRAAAARGQSVQAWCVDALSAATAAQGAA